jgi:transposase-like protein
MFEATKNADTVRCHLRDKVPVGELAAELDVQPTLIHQWIHQVLTQAERAFGMRTANYALAGRLLVGDRIGAGI